MNQDRRRFARVPTNVDVAYRVAGQSAPTPSMGRTRNLSAGGVCMVFPEAHDVHTIVRLEFRLPGERDALHVSGRVAWVEEFIIGDERAYDTGLEFTGLDAAGCTAIERHIEKAQQLTGCLV